MAGQSQNLSLQEESLSFSPEQCGIILSQLNSEKQLLDALSLTTELKPALLCTKCHLSIFPSLPPWLQWNSLFCFQTAQAKRNGNWSGV